jgi:hypothetical protein
MDAMNIGSRSVMFAILESNACSEKELQEILVLLEFDIAGRLWCLHKDVCGSDLLATVAMMRELAKLTMDERGAVMQEIRGKSCSVVAYVHGTK